jgi:hypothetical protein
MSPRRGGGERRSPASGRGRRRYLRRPSLPVKIEVVVLRDVFGNPAAEHALILEQRVFTLRRVSITGRGLLEGLAHKLPEGHPALLSRRKHFLPQFEGKDDRGPLDWHNLCRYNSVSRLAGAGPCQRAGREPEAFLRLQARQNLRPLPIDPLPFRSRPNSCPLGGMPVSSSGRPPLD